MQPDTGDVIVGRESEGVGTFVLGSFAARRQCLVRCRDEAMAQALALAKRLHARAWIANGDDTFRLLGSFKRAKGS